MERGGFEEVWRTLELDVSNVDPAQTITPRGFERLTARTVPSADPSSAAGASLGHTPLLPGETHPAVARLPLLGVDDGAAPADEADLVLGGRLGLGGMGVVHLARQRSLERDVAIKQLTRLDGASVEALLREAVINGSLEHPNIVPVHALGRDAAGRPVLVMKHVEGRRWTDVLREEPAALGSASLDRHLQVLLAVCNAVQYAHSRGVVHRDIKPANVMVGSFGEVYLLDWGVAGPVGAGQARQLVGTPGYMAPEMVTCEPVTERTDVYLLGATLHHVLTGRPRHTAPEVFGVLRSAWASEPVGYAGVPEDLAGVANRACARSPADRYPNVAAFQGALEAHLRHRASIEVASAAAARLPELRALLDDRGADPHRVDEVAGATRYGLRQALDGWPENEAARRDLCTCLSWLTTRALDADDPAQARALLDEWRALDPSADGNGEIARAVQRGLRKQEALARLGKELDLSVSGRAREVFMITLWLGTSTGSAALIAAHRLGGLQVTHALGVGVAGFVLSGILLVQLVASRRLFATVVDQRIMFTVNITSAAVLLHRLYGWLLGSDPHHVWAQDLFVLALTTALAGVHVSVGVLGVTAFLGALALVASAAPSLAVELTSFGVSGMTFLLALLFFRWAR